MTYEQPLPPLNLTDPAASFLNSSCLDLLLIELVPTAQHLANQSSSNLHEGAKSIGEDEQKEAASRKLEAIGYRVGQGIAERFSRDHPRFSDTLDVIKFLCKDLWMLVFRKQIDNLKTNHRGVYVLTDNLFKPLSRMSTQSLTETTSKAQIFLWFPCGLIRGALSSMGIHAIVTAESVDLPGAVFQIKTAGARP